MQYFITAIGTDSGKTIFSALLASALKADYWKPVQAGYPRDTETIKNLARVPTHPEQYLLNTPASPHHAAALDGVEIKLSDFQLPNVPDLIVEGAGGLMVPLNTHDLVIDLAAKWQIPIILVCNLYLGSINHTLLSIDYLKRRHLSVAGIVFNGPSTPASEQIIEKYCPWPVLFHLPRIAPLDQVEFQNVVEELRDTLPSGF